MKPERHTRAEALLVAGQLGRQPREPWRVSSRCRWGHPTTITSPSWLDDGTPFPNLSWLACPYLVERVSGVESAGGVAEFAQRAAENPELAEALHELDWRVRQARRAESGGVDACATVGLAGQRDPLGVKCLHAHVALQLVALDDPIGREVLERVGHDCDTNRCAELPGGTREREGS